MSQYFHDIAKLQEDVPSHITTRPQRAGTDYEALEVASGEVARRFDQPDICVHDPGN